MTSIAIGADDAALELKNLIKQHLQEKNIDVSDYSNDAQNSNPLYPDIARTLANAIKEGKHERGILVCGTGIGMAIVANKVRGFVRHSATTLTSAERARKSNNAQVMTLGARVIGPELARSIVNSWLESEFEAGGSSAKVDKISYYEQTVTEK